MLQVFANSNPARQSATSLLSHGLSTWYPEEAMIVGQSTIVAHLAPGLTRGDIAPMFRDAGVSKSTVGRALGMFESERVCDRVWSEGAVWRFEHRRYDVMHHAFGVSLHGRGDC
jgi:hypothetical protein